MFESDFRTGDPGTGDGPSVDAALGRIEQGIAQLNAAQLWRLGDGQLREVALRARALLAILDHAGLRLLAAVETRPDSVPGAAPDRAAATLLISAARSAPGAAHADAAAAVLLHAANPGLDGEGAQGLPLMSAALGEGAITRAHADVVCSVVRRLPKRLLEAVDVTDAPDGRRSTR